MVGKCNINHAIDLLFDYELGLSVGEINEEEDEDAYCY